MKVSKKLECVAAMADYGKEQFLAGFSAGVSELEFVLSLVKAMPKSQNRDRLIKSIQWRQKQVTVECQRYTAERFSIHGFIND